MRVKTGYRMVRTEKLKKICYILPMPYCRNCAGIPVLRAADPDPRAALCAVQSEALSQDGERLRHSLPPPHLPLCSGWILPPVLSLQVFYWLRQ